jgi:hypothetical protein
MEGMAKVGMARGSVLIYAVSYAHSAGGCALAAGRVCEVQGLVMLLVTIEYLPGKRDQQYIQGTEQPTRKEQG